MRPKKHKATREDDLFRARLDQIIKMKHELAQLAGRIDWGWLDGEIAPLYSDKGRPGIESRVVIGLLLLKRIYGLSDEGGASFQTASTLLKTRCIRCKLHGRSPKREDGFSRRSPRTQCLSWVERVNICAPLHEHRLRYHQPTASSTPQPARPIGSTFVLPCRRVRWRAQFEPPLRRSDGPAHAPAS